MELKELISLADERIKEYRELKELGMFYNSHNFIPGGVHYPLITDYPEIEYDEMFKGYKKPKDEMFDAYVHIPFCSKCCTFCHYPSLYNNSDEEKDKYITAIDKNMDIYMQTVGIDKIKLKSALIAGGTSTDLTPKQLERFLQIFTSKCDMSKTTQFNYDVSPHTLINEEGITKLKILKEYGVGRVTIGIQTLNEAIMKAMNRPHNKAEGLQSIKNALDLGFKVNIEFIFGYPQQTLENWFEDLKEMVTLGADEIQFYRLKIDAYGDQQGNIKIVKEQHADLFPTVEDTFRMKAMVIDYLKKFGYIENMRRVFTKTKADFSHFAFGQCCRMRDQLAFGVTGYSNLSDRFVLNTYKFDKFYERINEGKLPFDRGIVRDADTQQRWALIMPLKNYFVDKKYYKEQTNVDIENSVVYPIIQVAKEYGLIEENEKQIKLTPKGSFFADEVVGLFYNPKYNPFKKEEFKEGPLNPYSLNSRS